MAVPTANSGMQLSTVLPWLCRSCTQKARTKAFAPRKLPKRNISQRYLRKEQDAEAQWKEQAVAIKQGQKQAFLDFLESRGYVGQIAGERKALDTLLTEKRIGAYVGIDPTAPSIHVGHLVPLMVLFWMFIHGYHAVSLLGGATARVGDPTDRTTERKAPDHLTRKINMARMHMQLKRLWMSVTLHTRQYGFKEEWAWHRELVNNNAWLNKLPIAEVLRVLGPGMRLSPMLARDTVKTRMQSGEGMSLSEFMYPVLQSWDWWYMYDTKKIQLQIGGFDQFGNITAGIDAINYINKNHSNPRFQKEEDDLLDRPMGFTFGKSAGNAIWLDKECTSSFDLYQFFLRTADADVERYLKLFTFIPNSDISTIMNENSKDPSKRFAQHRLAHEVLSLVHSPQDAKNAAEQHSNLFSREKPLSIPIPNASSTSFTTSKNTSEKPEDITRNMNKYAFINTVYTPNELNITLPRSLVISQPVQRVLYAAGLVGSKSEGHRLCVQQGAYVGSRPAEVGPMGDALEFSRCKTWRDPERINDFILEGSILILRVGKWKIKIIHIIPDEEYESKGMTCPAWEERKAGLRAEEEKRDTEEPMRAGASS